MARRIDGRNTLQAIDDAMLFTMFDFAAEGWKLGRVRITTRQRSDRHTSGRAWPKLRGVTQLHLSLASPAKWRPAQRGAYHYAIHNLGRSRFVCATLEEEALFVIAHEVRHLIQGRYARYGKVWGSRGRFSERDCDAFAVRTVRRWRRERGIVGTHRGVSHNAATPAPVKRAPAGYRVREYVLEPTDCTGEIFDAVHADTRPQAEEFGRELLTEWAGAACVNMAAIDTDGVYHYLLKFTRDAVHVLSGATWPEETGAELVAVAV